MIGVEAGDLDNVAEIRAGGAENFADCFEGEDELAFRIGRDGAIRLAADCAGAVDRVARLDGRGEVEALAGGFVAGRDDGCMGHGIS